MNHKKANYYKALIYWATNKTIKEYPGVFEIWVRFAGGINPE